ncbi:MAG: class I SAM-dependent methyltransferase [Thermomicrobiales bacterium]
MTQSPASGATRPASEVQAMFGRIVPRYDLVNRLMTGGRDVAWRRMVASVAVAGGRRSRVIDVATGTGDLAIALAGAGAQSVVGLDFVPGMLRAAAGKPAIGSWSGWEQRGMTDTPDLGAGTPDLMGVTDGRVRLVAGDAMRLPFPDDTFDACTVSFGLRNMADYEGAVREMTRVLRPGGRWVCLELTPYRFPLLNRVFGWYFGAVVPVIGGWLSGDRAAYRYLPASVAAFPPADDLAAIMRAAGLENVRYTKLGGGAVAMHVGEKPG